MPISNCPNEFFYTPIWMLSYTEIQEFARLIRLMGTLNELGLQAKPDMLRDLDCIEKLIALNDQLQYALNFE